MKALIKRACGKAVTAARMLREGEVCEPFGYPTVNTYRGFQCRAANS